MGESDQFPSQLSSSDSIMWRIESDPVLRSPILVVGLLDRDPDWRRVTAAAAAAVAQIPRLRQRLVNGSRGARPHWVDDPAFSLDYHLRRVRAPHPPNLRTVLDMAEPTITAPFDTARPLWEMTIVEGLEGGRAAFLLRFHHTITDGVGGMELAWSLFGHSRRAKPTNVTAPNGRFASLTSAINAVRTGVAIARHPATSVKSLVRMLSPASEGLSPLFTARGLDRRLDTLEISLDGLRRAAHRFDGTVNDAFLASLGGALHEYHDRLGKPIRAVRVTMPISLRQKGDPPGGNRFTPARFVMPIDDPDPVVRARIAGAITRSWRHDPVVGLTGLFADVLDRLPGSMLTKMFGAMLEGIDIDAVDVPGLREAAYLADARIDRMWAFAPPTGAALSVTLLSHLDTACIAVLCDRAAVKDPDLLVSCLEEAFDEFLIPERVGASA